MATFAKLVLFLSAAPLLLGQAAPAELDAHARAAQMAESRGDFKTAAREYGAIAESLPENAEVQSNLGVALYFEDDKRSALRVFRKAIALNPGLFAPHLFSGLAWYRLSNPDAAVPELETAVHLNGNDVLARTWLGYAYIGQYRYGKAIEELRAASGIAPGDIDIWYALGQAYLQAGNEATANLMATAPDGGRAWQLAGEQFELQGDRHRALKMFLGAYQRRPDLTELHAEIIKLGGAVPANSIPVQAGKPVEDELYRSAHRDERSARTAFQKVSALAPDSYRAHQIMAQAYKAERHYEQSNKEYERVLELKPNLPGIHEAIGKNLILTGRVPEAVEQFQAELEIQPQSSTAYMNMGNALLLMQREEDAEKMLQRSLRLDRPPAETYKLLGKIELYRQNNAATIDALTKYVEMNPGDSDAYFMLSRAYRAIGNKAEMNRMLDLYKKTSQDVKERNQAERSERPLLQHSQPANRTSVAGGAPPN